MSESTLTAKPEPLQLPEPDSDAVEKLSSCNHVIVNYDAKTSGKKSKGRKKGSSAYCVMCGEIVSDKEKKKRLKSIDDILTERQSPVPKDSLGPQKSVIERKDSRQKIFAGQRSSTLSLRDDFSENIDSCSMHSHKKIKYFCEDHQEIGCSVCINVLHRKCNRVMFIRDEIHAASWDKTTSNDVMDTLKRIHESFSDVMEKNRKVRQSVEEQIEEARRKRAELRQRLVKLLDDFDRTTDKMMGKFADIADREIDATIEVCNEAVKEIELSCKALESVNSSDSPICLFIATQKAIGHKEKYAILLSRAVTNTKEMYVDLATEVDIPCLEDLVKIGTVNFSAEEVRFSDAVISSVSKLPHNEVRTPRNVVDVFSQSAVSTSPSSPSFYGKFSTKLADDIFVCENVSASFLTDGRVAIVDNENRNLKVFDMKFTQGSSIGLTSGPRGLAVINPQEVAVSLPDESKIQFISIGKKLKATRSILTCLPCYGIVHHNQELVLLCDDGFSNITIQSVDLTGHVIRTIDMNKSGRNLFKNPQHLSLNPDGQQMFVTDRGHLVCLDTEGSVLFRYADDNLENARGVTTDDVGRLYVCGTSSNNIHQLSPDGQKIQEIFHEDDVTAPQAVCYFPDKRLLLVTCGGSDDVVVLKLAKS